MDEVWIVHVPTRKHVHSAFEYELDARTQVEKLRAAGQKDVITYNIPFVPSSGQAGANVSYHPHREMGLTVEQWITLHEQLSQSINWPSDDERDQSIRDDTLIVMSWMTPEKTHCYAAASAPALKEFTGYPKE